VLIRKYGFSKSNFPLFTRKVIPLINPLEAPLPYLESEKELGKPQIALTLTQISTPSVPCQEILIEEKVFDWDRGASGWNRQQSLWEK
jgi:hypothetical protein